MKNKTIPFLMFFLFIFLTGCASALDRAQQAVDEGNYEQALVEYDAALAEELAAEDRYTALTGRANVNNIQGNADATLSDLAEALTVTNAEGAPAGDLKAVYRSRIDILTAEERFTDAADEVGKLMPLDSGNVALFLEQGQLYAQAEAWEEVVSSMDGALAIDSASADALTLRGTAHLELRNFEQAIEDLKASLNGDVAAAMSDIDRKANLVDAYYELGQALYRLGDYQPSIDNFTEALTYAETDEDISRTLAERGFVYSELGEFDNALSDFDQSISLDPSLAIVYSYRSYVYVDQGNYEAAIADADQAIALGDDLSENTRSAIFHAKASALLNNGQYEEALVAATQSIELIGESDPDTARTFSMRSRINRNLGNYEAAVADATKAIEIGANDIAALPGFYYARSVAYYRQDLYPEALSDQLAAIELGRVSAADYEYLGDIYFFSGDNINAISAYETAITLDATNPWLYYYLGDIYEADGNFDQATINYGQAISLDSEEVTFVEAMANLKWDEGNYDLAIVGFQEAIRINPTDPWLHNSLGDVYYDADDDQAAEASYLMATQLDPTVSLFFENLGLSLRVQEKYGDALIAYSNSLEIDPDGGFSWFGRGATYYLMGMDPEAIADLQKAKEYDIGQDLLELVDELLAEMGA